MKPQKTIIHINQHIIRSNNKTGAHDPVITCKRGSKNTYAQEVVIHGPSKVVYSPQKPLSCGARVWIETFAEVEMLGAIPASEFMAAWRGEADEG